MSTQPGFSFTDLPTIQGYLPRFNRLETLLDLKGERVQVGGGFSIFGDYDDVAQEPKFETHYHITVLGLRINGDHRKYFDENSIRDSDDHFTIAAKCANTWMGNKANKQAHPEVWAFFADNAKELNNSKRYWKAVDHLKEIVKVEDEIRRKQRQVERARLVAALNAYEVINKVELVGDERQRVWAELSGGLPYNSPEDE